MCSSMGESIIEGQEQVTLSFKMQHNALNGLEEPDTVALAVIRLEVQEQFQLGLEG